MNALAGSGELISEILIQDVCEDAISIKQKSGVSRINYGGVSTPFQ